MKEEVDAGLQSGWLMRCASVFLPRVSKFNDEATKAGKSIREHVYQIAAEAK